MHVYLRISTIKIYYKYIIWYNTTFKIYTLMAKKCLSKYTIMCSIFSLRTAVRLAYYYSTLHTLYTVNIPCPVSLECFGLVSATQNLNYLTRSFLYIPSDTRGITRHIDGAYWDFTKIFLSVSIIMSATSLVNLSTSRFKCSVSAFS